MLRLLVRTSLCAVVVLSLFGGLAVAFSKSHPRPPALEGFVHCIFTSCEDFRQWWRDSDDEGIMETLTTYGYQPKQIGRFEGGTDYWFTADGLCDVRISVPSENSDWVRSMFIDDCPSLRLGDLLTAIGDPLTVSVNGTHFRYERGVTVRLESIHWFSRFTPVSQIFILEYAAGSVGFEWAGVRAREYYCQSQPTVAADTC